MLLYNNSLKIYFGNVTSALDRSVFDSFATQEILFSYNKLKEIKNSMYLDKLALLKQIHSDLGYNIDINYCSNINTLKHEGDYLITKLNSVGLGIYTADCLPIIFYDNLNNAIGLAHAGWPGSVKQIGVKTAVAMCDQFGTKISDLQVYFGPSAKDCCYEVKPDFKEKLEDFKFANQLFQENNNKLTFNLPLFNKLQLQEIGIVNFNLENNTCTICDESFCSYRRDGEKALRQLTVVSLNSNL